jgi:hypothetical protein
MSLPAGTGPTKSERNIEVLMPTLPAQAIFSQHHIDVRFGSIVLKKSAVATREVRRFSRCEKQDGES